MTYAEIILPLPLNATFTYSIPSGEEHNVKVGSRVIVPFGRQKQYTGVVSNLTTIPPKDIQVKEILQVLDREPIVRHPQLQFWSWLSEYYMSSIGDVYKAALPSGLKLESETKVELNTEETESEDLSALSEREAMVVGLLQSEGALSVKEISTKTGFGNIHTILKGLLEKDLVIISEKLVEKYRSKKEVMVRLNPHLTQKEAFEAVKGAKKQETALLALLQLIRNKGADEGVSRNELCEKADVSTAIISAMEKKGVVEVFKTEVSRFKYTGSASGTLPKLSPLQAQALTDIHKSFFEHPITLLHGVTASGKTEIYIHLIDYVLSQGNQVLFLVPEIALTTQLTRRLQRVFGQKVVIYHSRFSDAERVETYNRLLHSHEPCVVIGARSSVFLPFSTLGLIIIDEEHESSYKQFDPAPRYNARDAATMLARMHGAKTLLGSATPSVETYYKAQTGRYGLVELLQRFDNSELPRIQVVDMKQEYRQKSNAGTFSSEIMGKANDVLSMGKQVIFFHNRRGFSPFARCKACGFVPHCQHCDVSLTYHQRMDMLVCHYCGSQYHMPQVCPQCREPQLEVVGYGTERVEDETADLFEGYKIMRMDLDTTRNKDAYSNIIDDFSAHKADILVGTQMVTKGLDFGDVNLVGILNADTIINYPDFRAAERAFNMLEQVSGRAGRRDSDGVVILQTYNPEHKIIRFLENHDYKGFYESEIEERRLFNYPPFTRVIYIYIKHKDETIVQDTSTNFAQSLRGVFGNRVFGPDKPLIGRIQTLHIRRIMLKIETNTSMKTVKELILNTYATLGKTQSLSGVVFYCDVDPY